MYMSLSNLWEIVEGIGPLYAAIHGAIVVRHSLATESNIEMNGGKMIWSFRQAH